MTSMTSAAVMCDADESCSVLTARLRSRLLQYLLEVRLDHCASEIFLFQLAFFLLTYVHNVAKWTLFLSVCATRITSFLLLTLSNCQAGIVPSFLHSLSTAAFCIWNFHQDEEIRENRTSWMTWREDDGHVNDLSQCGVTHDQ